MGDVAAEFLAAARAFRRALTAEEVDEGQFARQVRNALARVYLAGALLGPPGATETDEHPLDRVPHDGSKSLQERLAARFGEHDLFVDVFDPSGLVDADAKPIEHSLSLGLVEIDEDLAQAIGVLERDLPDALWDVRWALENHWGQHAVACLRPLHQLTTYGVV